MMLGILKGEERLVFCSFVCLLDGMFSVCGFVWLVDEFCFFLSLVLRSHHCTN